MVVKRGPVWYLPRREEGRTQMGFVPPSPLEVVRRGVAAFQRYRAVGQRLAATNLARLQREVARQRRAPMIRRFGGQRSLFASRSTSAR